MNGQKVKWFFKCLHPIKGLNELLTNNPSKRNDAPPDCILTVRSKVPKFYGLQGVEEKEIEIFCFDGFTYPEGYDAHVQARLFWKDHKKTYPKGSVVTMELYYLGVYAYSLKYREC